MTSDGGNFCFCAVDVMRLGVSYSSVAAWAYVIMGGVLVAPLVGGGGGYVCFCVLLGDSRVRIGYAHAATEEYDTPSRSTSTAQKQKLPPSDVIHRTGYNPTQGSNKPHRQEIAKKEYNGARAACIHTHCPWPTKQGNEIS
jgi:hypothetical protein